MMAVWVMDSSATFWLESLQVIGATFFFMALFLGGITTSRRRRPRLVGSKRMDLALTLLLVTILLFFINFIAT
ncbi:hypothetical protein [Mechercharimyces sp. CAU 1602]|uniref:hypothetical protein n=1 Tax=Mechercharimyces sp. CAU 1602 TaxID=2973933 RepID=UPI0021624C46|nr:hypothetical protein [Mechercharimyces sp. CAU 1602]MCS1352012.1 hypothetical protein [Mechercharimyces sp. CAU 1602]